MGRIILTVYSSLLALFGLMTFLLTMSEKPMAIGLAIIPAGLFISGWTIFLWAAVLVISLTYKED
ncbi:MAG: hypothetical protein P1S60_15610 [Anaerolineae bacterium]|nr:hypothetical protein [Anaerolineae bacterium]